MLCLFLIVLQVCKPVGSNVFFRNKLSQYVWTGVIRQIEVYCGFGGTYRNAAWPCNLISVNTYRVDSPLFQPN